MDNEDDELVFEGYVHRGQGDFSNMVIPGRTDESYFPGDWPAELASGSLNVRITGYPPEFQQRGWGAKVTVLDSGLFQPAFVLPGHAILNNTIPNRRNPSDRRTGDAQVWRATLENAYKAHSCWVLRRLGSGYRDVLELVSEVRIRDLLGLDVIKTWPVRVRMNGRWTTEAAG